MQLTMQRERLNDSERREFEEVYANVRDVYTYIHNDYLGKRPEVEIAFVTEMLRHYSSLPPALVKRPFTPQWKLFKCIQQAAVMEALETSADLRKKCPEIPQSKIGGRVEFLLKTAPKGVGSSFDQLAQERTEWFVGCLEESLQNWLGHEE